MRVLIVGCGYVGLALGAELVRQGHQVWGMRRRGDATGELARAGLVPLAADITQPTTLGKHQPDFDWVVNCASSSLGGAEDYRAVYLEGTRHLLRWLGRNPPRRYAYTSSTGVYAQNDGTEVTEESPTEPENETGRILVQTEQELFRAARERQFPAMVLRVSGIYGPGRGYFFHQFLRGEAAMSGDGSRVMNMIHQEDVARGLVAALERGEPGAVYNLSDDEPVSQRDFYGWLAALTRRPLPQSVDESANPARKRGVTHKRVSNRKLRLALGCELKYPTFRQGYSAEIARLQAAGQLPATFGQ